ncbi:MAG: DUF72 domain-containing protein [Ferruginibacter sp.]
MNKKGVVRIGTSNIVLPGSRQTFPAEYHLKSRLNYYSSLFNTLEVNSTFYKLPRPSTFEKWSLDVPENFQFTIKLWREITHAKNLQANLDKIVAFLKAAELPNKKKGCMLVQFPGKITLGYYNQVEQILRKIKKEDPENNWQKAIEFRSSTWYVGETYELLDEYGASMVLQDIPKAKTSQINKAAKIVYLRFHGPRGDYRGSYSNDFLQEQSNKISQWIKTGKDVYAYFNNTIGSAFENAMALKRMVEN